MIETQTYQRKTFSVDAIQVTMENIHDVAEWCGGMVHKYLDGEPKIFIHLDTVNTTYMRRTKAFVGDWILVSSSGFKIYKEKAFKNSFEKIELGDEEKHTKVLQQVHSAMRQQDAATYNGRGMHTLLTNEIADEITKRILQIFA